MDPTKKEDGFTDHEILKEIRDDLKAHIEDSATYSLETQKEISARPKRAEIVGWFSGIAIVTGAILAALP